LDPASFGRNQRDEIDPEKKGCERMKKYVRVITEATVDNPEVAQVFFDLVIDGEGKIVGKHLIFSYECFPKDLPAFSTFQPRSWSIGMAGPTSILATKMGVTNMETLTFEKSASLPARD
jgi:hypothetical protein